MSQLDIEVRNASRGEVGPAIEKNSEALHSYLVGQLAYVDEDFNKAILNFKRASELGGDMAPDINVRLAELYLRSGKLEEALAQADKAVEKEPDNNFNLLLKAGVLEALNRGTEAEPIYLMLIQTQPKLSDPYVLLASLYARQGQAEKGTAILKKYLALNPKEPLAHYYLARALEIKGDNLEAEKEYRKASELSPDNLELMVDLVRVLLRQKKIEAARALCQKILQKDPNHVTARKILSEFAIGSNKLDEALDHLAVVELEERDPTETRFKIALIQIEKQNFAEAIRELNLILAQNPTHAEARYYLGSVYAGAGRNKEAIEELSKIKKGEPMYVKARTFSAFVLRHMDDLEGAEKAARDALEQEPDSKRILAYLVLILRDEHKYEEAAELLEKVVAKDPTDDRMLFQYAVVLSESGERQKSREMMEKVIEVNPAHSDALNYLAYGLSERGEDLDRALVLINRALEITPNDGFYLDTQGWIYFKLGEYQKAEEILARAVDLTEQDIAVLEHYGDALAKNGKTRKALDIYQTGVDKAKDSKGEEDVQALRRMKEKLQEIKKNFPSISALPMNMGKVQ